MPITELASDPEAYIEKLSKLEDLRNTKIIENINYTVQHIPLEMEALKRIEYKSMEVDSVASYIKRFKLDYSELVYINYRIRIEGAKGNILKECLGNFDSYHDLVQYCSFDFGKDLYLVSGKDTFRSNETIFDPTYEISNSLNFTICFNKEYLKNRTTISSPFTLVVNDKLLKNGILKFELI